ncbi:MAG: DNA-3-methyladenine glycosylase family protein, partial [Gemmatimonadota bacterium]
LLMSMDMDGSRAGSKERLRGLAGPPGFDLAATVYSHGWCRLAPNRSDPEGNTLERAWAVGGGEARIRLSQPSGPGGPVEMEAVGGRGSRTGLSPATWAGVEDDVRHMLRLDEDFSAFHARCRSAGPPFEVAAERGFGRLLRSPTLFEDVVKVLATTNTTWSGTVAMVSKLVRLAGRGTFPGPGEVAALGTARIRDRGRWGYRAAYLSRFARAVANGKLDLGAWEGWPGSTADLEQEIRRVPGLGPYAAAQVLSLLGRYDRIGVDTVFRSFVKRTHFPRARKPVSDGRMLAVYEAWGEWKMLAYWFELWTDYVDGSAAESGSSSREER